MKEQSIYTKYKWKIFVAIVLSTIVFIVGNLWIISVTTFTEGTSSLIISYIAIGFTVLITFEQKDINKKIENLSTENLEINKENNNNNKIKKFEKENKEILNKIDSNWLVNGDEKYRENQNISPIISKELSNYIFKLHRKRKSIEVLTEVEKFLKIIENHHYINVNLKLLFMNNINLIKFE